MSFSGSSIWDLFADGTDSLEKTYSTSIKIMLDIPRETHRFLIEPLSERTHLKSILIQRFINFEKQVKKCPKQVMKSMFEICKYNVNTITGSNYRKIMLLGKKSKIDQIDDNDIKMLEYSPVPANEEWRVNLIKDLLEARNDSDLIPGFTYKELTDMLEFACVS